jgi:uncharacterized protein (DUF2062 family)
MALTPFFGLRTFAAFLISWRFRLNTPVTLLTVNTISNPWTLVPIIMLEYFLGCFLVHTIFGISLREYNPWWMQWVNSKLKFYMASDGLCLWSFVIGSHLIALATAFVAYPLVFRFFKRFEKYNEQI